MTRCPAAAGLAAADVPGSAGCHVHGSGCRALAATRAGEGLAEPAADALAELLAREAFAEVAPPPPPHAAELHAARAGSATKWWTANRARFGLCGPPPPPPSREADGAG
mmetsp:Transcript_16875/g.53803  ORF Transcript_16875/g.53803 Transcript_16875/m.53803 type:complete len:109 (-) Transcript_16875:8-334(-)